MAERRASVVGIREGEVTLRAQGACSDCGGCGGRCSLFPDDQAGLLVLPVSRFQREPRAGDELLLCVPEGWLTRTALRGYGMPLLGLLAGAALGQGLAVLAPVPPDAAALTGAVLGTLAAFTLSKGAEPQIAVLAPAAPRDALPLKPDDAADESNGPVRLPSP